MKLTEIISIMKTIFTGFLLLLSTFFLNGQIIINHLDTDITQLTETEINHAKSTLHIAYGHTSHGSHITYGMSGLVDFANNGGKGLSLPTDIFAWNNGGSGGALDLEEGDGYGSGWLDHDAGYYPNWVEETREYLDDPSHSDVNVIMWSWCGQIEDKYANGKLFSEYLKPMADLEADYPNVKFVYMTGHLDFGDYANNLAANDSIRRHCIREGKILYDFADIESYDPDGTHYEFADDNCDYYSSASDNTADGNWATKWRRNHTEGVDWFDCNAEHSDALNANQKAYAAWALFVALAKNDGTNISDPYKSQLSVYPNPFSNQIHIKGIEKQQYNINITNINGQQVYSSNYDGNSELDLENLSSGFYILKIETLNGKNQTFKIAKR